MRYTHTQTTFVSVLKPCSEKRYSVSVCGRFSNLQGTAVRYGVLTAVLRIAVCWFFQNGETRSQESRHMFSSFTKSPIKNQNTQLTEKSVGITFRIFPDYPIQKSQYPINKKISGYYPIHQNFLSGALTVAKDIIIIIIYFFCHTALQSYEGILEYCRLT